MSTNTDIILIKYQSDMSDLKKELQALTASNVKIEKELKNIGDAGKKASKEAADGFKKVGAVTKGLEGTFNTLKSQIAGVFAVQQLQAFVKESVKAAAAAEGIERAFNRIAPEGTLNKLREATKGTVSDVQLMANTVKASNFQIPVEKLATLFKFAQQRARETGESVDYLVDSIVLGIGRKSPLILDNLGISAVRLREKFKGIAAEEINVGAVAQAVGEIIEEETKKMGDSAETSADKIARWGAEWENYKVAVGEAVIQVATFFEGMIKGATKTSPEVDKMGNSFVRALEKIKNYAAYANPFLYLINNAGAGKKAVDELTKAEEDAAITNEQYHKSKTELVKVLDEELITLKGIYEQSLKDKNITESGILKTKAQIKAINDEMAAREAAAESNKQYTEASIEQLEMWIELGDAGAQKELSRRKKIEAQAKKEEDERKKAYSDLVARERDALAQSIKANEQYIEKIKNTYKEKFVAGEITEEELNHALNVLDEKKLETNLSTLKKQRATTKEVRGQIKDDIFKTETEITNFEVDQAKARADKEKEVQEQMEKDEKDRLDKTLKDYEDYWRDIEGLNVFFLQEGVYTQEEFDAIQKDNKTKQLQGTLEVLKDFDAKTKASAEQVAEETEKTQKELNDALIEENRRKNEKTIEDDKKAAEERKQINETLYSSARELASSFIDFNRSQNQAAAEEEINRLQENLDQQLENEYLTEQQREQLQLEFETKRRAIQNEQAQREKQAKIAQAVIDGIASVIAAKTLPEKIIVGALNAIQLGLLIAAPLPQYKDGDVDIQGPGTTTSDSIIARISKGESVINARSTRKHKDILKVINRGNDEELMKLIKVKYYPANERAEKKSDGFAENVLKQIALNNNFDDANIVRTLKNIRPATSKDIQGLGEKIEKSSRKQTIQNKRN